MEEDGMRVSRVRSPQDDNVRLLDLTVRAGSPTRSKCGRQTDDAGSVSSAVTAVDIVRAHNLPSELLCGIVHLIGCLGAAENPERLWAALPRRIKSRCSSTERLVPRRYAQRSILADHRLGQTHIVSFHLCHLLSIGVALHRPTNMPASPNLLITQFTYYHLFLNVDMELD